MPDESAGSRRSARRVVCLLACVGVLVTAPGQLRSQAPVPIFRGGTSYIRVDMYPSTRDGLVTDLRLDEVELREDNVAQKIERFELVRIPPGGPEAARVEPNSIRASQQAATDPRARVFVIFLDTLHVDVQTPDRVYTPLRRFLEEALGPDDLVAIMTPTMSVSDMAFTRRTTALSSILSQVGWSSWKVQDWDDLDATEQLYLDCYRSTPGDPGPGEEMIHRRRERLTLDALENLVVHLGEVREERKTVLVITEGWLLFQPNESMTETRAPSRTDVPIGDRLRGGRGAAGTDTMASTTRDQCVRDLLALSQLDHSDRVRRISETANRRNVSFYPIAPGLSTAPSKAIAAPPGLTRVPPAPGGSSGDQTVHFVGNASNQRFVNVTELQRQSELRAMAEETDGVAIVNTNIIDAPMRRIIADTSSYYLLGYQSTNSALDGKYRKITVRVARPGVQVRARPGYRALSAAEIRTAAVSAPAPPAAMPRAPEGIARALARLSSTSARAPLLLRTAWTASGAAGNTGASLWVVGELGADLRGTAAWKAGGRARLTLVGVDGGVAGTAVTDLAGTPPVFAVRMSEGGRLTAGTYALRVALSSINGETLSESIQVSVPATPSPLGDPMLLRRGTVASAQPVATADSQFRRSERIRVELATGSQATASTRLLDTMGRPLNVPAPVTTRADPSVGVDWVVVEFAAAPFAPGDYVLEVTQGAALQVVGFRVVH